MRTKLTLIFVTHLVAEDFIKNNICCAFYSSIVFSLSQEEVAELRKSENDNEDLRDTINSLQVTVCATHAPKKVFFWDENLANQYTWSWFGYGRLRINKCCTFIHTQTFFVTGES